MKKLEGILLVLLCLAMVGCSSSKKEPKNAYTIMKDNNLTNEGWLGEKFWRYSFSDMTVIVAFNDFDSLLEPEDYYTINKIDKDDITLISVVLDDSDMKKSVVLLEKEDKFVVAEDETNTVNSKELVTDFEARLNKLGLVSNDIQETAVRYYNNEIRKEAVKECEKQGKELIEKLPSLGFEYTKDDSGVVRISSPNEEYVIRCKHDNVELAYVSDEAYMFFPILGLGSYNTDDESAITYRCSDNALLKGNPTLEQFAIISNLQDGCDDFLFKTGTTVAVLAMLYKL